MFGFNINDLKLDENVNALIDTAKKRVEISIVSDSSNGTIVAYYPIKSLQVYCYMIDGTQIPDMWDLGLRKDFSGSYLRILVCKHGHIEFEDKGVSENLSGGEFCIKCGKKANSHFSFSADSFTGIELVLQVDSVVEESVLLQMLQTALSGMGITKEDFQKNQWYFSDYSKASEQSLERLYENCINGAEAQLVLINVAEVGYNLGNDYKGCETKERKYPTNIQKTIAEDIHSQLTNNYNEHLTAVIFAEKYGLSDTTVKSYFKNLYGYSFKEYQTKVRMEKAAELLLSTDLKVVEIALKVGYTSQGKFIGAFKKYYDATPSEYRRIKRYMDVTEQRIG